MITVGKLKTSVPVFPFLFFFQEQKANIKRQTLHFYLNNLNL